MILLCKAILDGGKFVAWDTSTDDFYFRRWNPFTGDPEWDNNQWWANTYETHQAAETDITSLTNLGFTVHPLGMDALMRMETRLPR